MMRPSCASRSHADAGKKRAVVCSRPPSVVGVGIDTSGSKSSAADGLSCCDKGVPDNVGRKYMYICVVNLLGTFVGVTHRVNGINPSRALSAASLRYPVFELTSICPSTFLSKPLLKRRLI